MQLLDLGGNYRPYQPNAETTQEVGNTSKEIATSDELFSGFPLLLVLVIPQAVSCYESQLVTE